VADGLYGAQARHDILAPVVRRDLLLQSGFENAAIVLEQAFHAASRSAAHLAIVHPVFPLDRRHQHFGIRKCRLSVGREQSIHMVAVEM